MDQSNHNRQQAYPEDFANRDEDKFNYRYRGEAGH